MRPEQWIQHFEARRITAVLEKQYRNIEVSDNVLDAPFTLKESHVIIKVA